MRCDGCIPLSRTYGRPVLVIFERARPSKQDDGQGAFAAAVESSGIDILMGIGGAPEGVLAAAALKCMGGDMQGRLVFMNEEERTRARQMGIEDFEKVYDCEGMARGDVFFAATGVTNGDLLQGVRYFSGGAETQSIVMRSKSRTVRFVEARHSFDFKPVY